MYLIHKFKLIKPKNIIIINKVKTSFYYISKYYKSGKIKAEGIFENDEMQGEWKFYRESGQLSQIGNFKNNEKHGKWIRFDKNHKEEYNEEFKDGKLVKLK